jgi:hypothetical protein
MKSPAMANPTRMSGQTLLVRITPSAARRTAPLATTSLREHSQTDRMFRSSAR